MDFDNDYDAFQFDVGVAWKAMLLEKDERANEMAVIMNGMRNIVLANGAKMDKIKKPKSLLKPKDYGEPMNVNAILSALGGSGVVIQ